MLKGTVIPRPRICPQLTTNQTDHFQKKKPEKTKNKDSSRAKAYNMHRTNNKINFQVPSQQPKRNEENSIRALICTV